jgi:BASS family bile acid:Na+ symporter
MSSLKQPVDYQLSVILSFGIMNNVLVMVFSAEFFTPLEPTVAAVYTIPFYGLIIPLRLYQSRRNRPTPI